MARVLSKFRNPSDEVKERATQRYNLLESLHPIKYISGNGSFARYFGAVFLDDLVVFENLSHGNAAYIMFGNWEELAKLSRVELMAGRRGDFIRIIHRVGWETELRAIVLRELNKAA